MTRVLIAAAHKSSGKTTVSIGLTAALTRTGLDVQTFKKGPDYIDPMWLGRAARAPCYNLDFNTMTAPEIVAAWDARSQRQDNGRPADIRLIEANKGLFDGVDLEGSDSNAALAKLLNVPVVMVLDTAGITRGIAPLIQGYVGFDSDVSIIGVILNNVGGPRHESKLRAAMEYYTDVPVLGAVARDPSLSIAERHLGLTTPSETSRLDAKIDAIADTVAAGVDVAALRELACRYSRDGAHQEAAENKAPVAVAVAAAAAAKPASMPSPGPAPVATSGPMSAPRRAGSKPLRIGVARDAAFGFYYADDLEALAAAGAQIIAFNTMQDAALPDVDGLFIGGGFPETHMAELAGNARLRSDIKRAIEAGMPAYAECGGLMYLCRSLRFDGLRHDMVGVIPGRAVMHSRPQGRGYARLSETAFMPWPAAAVDGDGAAAPGVGTSHAASPAAAPAAGADASFAAHEFHYASLEDLGPQVNFAYNVLRGHGIDGRHDGIVMHNLLASFSHLRDTDANHWCARFVEFIRRKANA